MRRDIVSIGADQLSYEIRNIVHLGEEVKNLGQEIYWENVGDPINKGEKVPIWIKEIVKEIIDEDFSWGYCPTKGLKDTRKFLAELANKTSSSKLDFDDIIFFNGLGDAISKVYSLLRKEARILGPSPAYPTHSSAEGAHSGYEHLTYKLDPENNWIPDIEDIKLKVKYNDSIVGILIINPDNPTGMVYPKEVLEEIVKIAKENDLFLISDEIYTKLVYNGAKMTSIAELIDNVPAIVMKGISKEFPWPGGRCGWIEVYNKDKDENFARYVKSLVDSKMLEVCSTTLPQKAIPKIFSDYRYENYMVERRRKIEKRANLAYEILRDIPGLILNKPRGAFYMSIVFKEDALNSNQKLEILNPQVKKLIEEKTVGVREDKRFAYYLMGSSGICVVPLTSFCSDLKGFRITLLEENEKKFEWIFKTLKEKILEYLTTD